METSIMKVVHITDLHFQSSPKLTELFHLKRIMGSTNLYLFGRKTKFDISVQRAAIRKTIELQPDLVIITGDITAQALDSEFNLARKELEPILTTLPTILQAGNHDTYITKGPPSKMRNTFGEWMPNEGAGIKTFGDVSVLCVESCHSNLLSQGYVNPDSLKKASELLNNNTTMFTFFCMHYPLLDRNGDLYGPKTRAIKNAPLVLKWLQNQSGLNAFLHGHEHHGYKTTLQLKDTTIPSINPGSSGYAQDTKRDRTAHLARYTIKDQEISNLERFRFNNSDFEPEPGGAFQSKR
jgi:predicted phosphodiesterase